MPRRTAGPAAPRRSSPDLPAVLDEASGLRRHGDVLGAAVSLSEAAIDAAHSGLTECVVTGSVDRLDLTGARLADVRFDEVVAAEVVARDGRWRTVDVIGGRIGTLDLLRAELDLVVFQGVRIDYLSLPSARATDVRFDDCRIGTLDVPKAVLARIAFADSRVDEVDTRGLTAADLDLRGLEALSFTSPAGLRGVTLDERQAEQHAVAFAEALGITVAAD